MAFCAALAAKLSSTMIPPPIHQRRGVQLAAASIGVSALGYYLSHLETAPVTGRRRFIDVSPKLEKQVAQVSYSKILQKYSSRILPDNHPISVRVRNVVERLIAALGRTDLDWRVHVVNVGTPNAFVLPGGRIFVHTGILPVCNSDDGIAVVLGHEMAHQIARHSMEKLSAERIKRMFLLLFILVTGMPGGIAESLASIAYTLPFSRLMESEADHIGLLLAARACYDPREAVACWERMDRLEAQGGGSGGGGIPEFARTHPTSKKRKAQLAQLVPEALREFHAANCPAREIRNSFWSSLGGGGGGGGDYTPRGF